MQSGHGHAAVIRADLDRGSVERAALPDDWRSQYVGGKGLAARYLFEETSPGVDPLAPENALIFAVGPLTGRLPGEARYAAVTKSPLTGAFLDSYAGGSFAGRLAGSLDDALLLSVTGEADEPTAIHVSDGTATLEPVPELADTDTVSAERAFANAAVACIGPAGEHGVRYATIASDGGDHHAGRGGAGCVMGAKNLKAVVAHDDAPAHVVESEPADSHVGRWRRASASLETVDFADHVGALPTRGWQTGTFESADDIGITGARRAASGRERPDVDAPGGFTVPVDGHDTVPRGGTTVALGSGLGIDDFDAVAELGAHCDRLGIDVLSAGNAVALAVRASDAGVIDADLSFGDAEAVRTLVAGIATREGELGDLLADGVSAAARELDADDLIPTVKAMAFPSYDPRAAPSMALAYATSDRGACHRRAHPIERAAIAADEWTDAKRVEAVVAEQNARAARWCLVADDFAGDNTDVDADWIREAGLDVTASSLRTLGERVWNLVRLFNRREGFERRDDSLPAAMTTPLPDGPAAGARIDPDRFDAMLDAYYDHRGWTEQGHPTRETLDRLGVDVTIDPHTHYR